MIYDGPRIVRTSYGDREAFTRLYEDGRTHTHSQSELAAARAFNAFTVQHAIANKAPVEEPRARTIITAQEAVLRPRWNLRDAMRARKKPNKLKPTVDRYGWPTKATTASKDKKEKSKPIVQPEAERSTGFILPSVVVGGFSAHLNSPVRWDVTLYKSATISGNFTGFDLPEIKPIKEHLADLQRKLLGLPEDEELEESEACKIGQYPAANALFSEQRARGVSYSISCKARMTAVGFNRLKALLRIQSDGSQLDPNTAEIELLGLAWSGAFNGPSSAPQFEVELPPHILQEDGSPGSGARAMILRHDGSAPTYIPKSAESPPVYANVQPDLIHYDLLNLNGPADTPSNPNIVVNLDLDFLTIDAVRWALAITRHT